MSVSGPGGTGGWVVLRGTQGRTEGKGDGRQILPAMAFLHIADIPVVQHSDYINMHLHICAHTHKKMETVQIKLGIAQGERQFPDH